MGTCMGIGGEGFCILAGDTRMSLGYDIISRNTSRVYFLLFNELIRFLI
jgi:20S proteasome alpha/beta subunit